MESDISDNEKQKFIDEATWGLDVYENEQGTVTVKTKSYGERREVVKAKLRGRGTLTAQLIKETADAYTNGDVEVEFLNGVIQITFVNIYGRPKNMEDMYETLDDNKPAHLALKCVFRYRTHGELKAYTHGQLHNHTHFELREGELN